MNIRTLNSVGGMMFASGSLWFLNTALQANTAFVQAAICANSQNGCSNLEKQYEIAQDIGGTLWFNATVASFGAGLACLRESKD